MSTIDTPWGYREDLYELPFGNGNYKVRKLMVRPGDRLSLQRHALRSEFWIIESGTAEVTLRMRPEIFGTLQTMSAGESITIKKNITHRVKNVGKTPLIIVETQWGECRDDDIQRFEDDYGR